MSVEAIDRLIELERSSQAYLRCLGEIRLVADSSIGFAVARLLRSDMILEQLAGLDILREVGPGRVSDEILEKLVQIIFGRSTEDLAAAAVLALGNGEVGDAVPILVAAALDARPAIRCAVASALSSFVAAEEKQAREHALETCIALSYDVDEEVRDAAVFTLATFAELTNERVRSALLAAARGDSAYTTRLEAIVGLAEAGDPSAYDLVQQFLSLAPDGLLFEAALALKATHLLPALRDALPRLTGRNSQMIARSALEALEALKTNDSI